MILARAERKDFSNEPRPDLQYVEDGIYPASLVKCTEEQGQYGPQIKWLFTLDEVNDIKIFVNVYTSMSWAPGSKLDGFLVSLGIDTTNNFDISTFNTDSIQKGTKILLMVQKQKSKASGNVYLKVAKWLPYSSTARGAEPLNFPKEHMIYPQQTQQQGVPQQVNVQWQQPQAPQFNQPVNPSWQPSPNMNMINPNATRVTSPVQEPQYPGIGQTVVKKVDFNSNL